MKTTVFAMMALVGLMGSVRAETVSVVQITDMRGQSEFQVMNREELANLTKEIKEETAVFPAVLADCKKEWEANKDNTLPFQGNRIKVRSAKKGVDFMDRAKADKKRSQLEDRASTKQSEEVQKEEKKAKQSKAKDEEIAKEEARTRAFEEAVEMVSKKMGDKLGRPVPSFGLASLTKEEPKKEELKKDEKKDKKDEKKEDKKEEKKAKEEKK